MFFCKNVFFIVAPTGESWSENRLKKRLSFAQERFEKKSYLLPTTIRRAPGTNAFIFLMRMSFWKFT